METIVQLGDYIQNAETSAEKAQPQPTTASSATGDFAAETIPFACIVHHHLPLHRTNWPVISGDRAFENLHLTCMVNCALAAVGNIDASLVNDVLIWIIPADNCSRIQLDSTQSAFATG